VTNNVVVTSSCWGIDLGSVHHGRIINNTVLSDERRPTNGICKPVVAVGDRTHDGSSSNDVVVRNNLSNGYYIYNIDPDMVLDHNICAGINGACRILSYLEDGKPNWGVLAIITSSTGAALNPSSSTSTWPSSSSTSDSRPGRRRSALATLPRRRPRTSPERRAEIRSTSAATVMTRANKSAI
jgi:hypothetical protein